MVGPIDRVPGSQIRVPTSSLPTVRRALPTGSGSSTLQGQAASILADRLVARYCEVRRSHPGLWQNGASQAASALLGNAPNILAEELCRPYDNEAPGSGSGEFQVVGGQCSTQYRVSWTGTQISGASAGGSFADLPGPIRSVTLVVRQAGVFRAWDVRIVYGPSSLVITPALYSVQAPSQYLVSWNYSIARLDGQPDNCGNAPPTPLPPVPPQWTVPVNVQLGPQSVSIPVTIGGADVALYPNFEFDPTINLPGGIDVNIGPSEVVFNFPERIPNFPAVVMPPLNPVIPLETNLINIGNNQIEINDNVLQIAGNVTQIINIFNEGVPVDLSELEALIRACCCNPEYTYERDVLAASSRGGVYPLPVGTIAVVCEQTAIPGRSPGSSGEGIVPDARWEGWVSFGADGKPGTRQQLQWRDSAYPVPKHSDTFLLFGLYDSSYKITAIIETKVVPE